MLCILVLSMPISEHSIPMFLEWYRPTIAIIVQSTLPTWDRYLRNHLYFALFINMSYVNNNDFQWLLIIILFNQNISNYSTFIALLRSRPVLIFRVRITTFSYYYLFGRITELSSLTSTELFSWPMITELNKQKEGNVHCPGNGLIWVNTGRLSLHPLSSNVISCLFLHVISITK